MPDPVVLDRDSPYAVVEGDDQGRAFEQNGVFFKLDGSEWTEPAGIDDLYVLGRRKFARGSLEYVKASTLSQDVEVTEAAILTGLGYTPADAAALGTAAAAATTDFATAAQGEAADAALPAAGGTLSGRVDGTILSVSDALILPKTAGRGMKVDVASPTFPWKDLIGDVSPKFSGVGAPVRAAFRAGSVANWFYAANDLLDLIFHVPHDYLPGSDLFIHLHWGHNGTAISGSLNVDFHTTYAKGHNQANFGAEITAALAVSTPDIATVPQYRHRVDEIQLSAASPTAGQLDTDDIEVDGLILITAVVTAIPTITGGTTNKPAFFTADIHYQSTGVGTKNKAPNFYGA
jgi:hypothetical protein